MDAPEVFFLLSWVSTVLQVGERMQVLPVSSPSITIVTGGISKTRSVVSQVFEQTHLSRSCRIAMSAMPLPVPERVEEFKDHRGAFRVAFLRSSSLSFLPSFLLCLFRQRASHHYRDWQRYHWHTKSGIISIEIDITKVTICRKHNKMLISGTKHTDKLIRTFSWK